MENLLTIDNGNTNTTVGIFNQGLEKVLPFDQLTNRDVETVLVSSVGKEFKQWEGPDFINLKSLIDNNQLLQMPINYSETLGADRLSGAYWVFKNFIETRKAEKVMLIDAGTFTTIDLITKDGFEGGHIFTGTETLLKSFTHGNQLPHLELKETNLQTLPKSTEEAILGSVQLAESGLYEKWWDKFRPEIIVLSGGLAHWHKKYLPSEIIEQNHIVHLGLYEAFKDMSH